jgi:A/G-specific adenine glycosylase
MMESEKVVRLRRNLLGWYDHHRRDLPWRKTSDPYAIWVSEVMLQQTLVAVVSERYQMFLDRFPTVVDLALAPEQDVLALWSGLGYYRRARMLQKTAQFVTDHQQGRLPRTVHELRLLPGIGTYTAAAIASIAYGERVAVVDGNVERVLCRMMGWEAGRRTGGAHQKRRIENLAEEMIDPERPGDFNQALMELGATVCRPRSPHCLVCPLCSDCKTRGEHSRPPRAPMLSREVAYALSVRTSPIPDRAYARSAREVLLEQRPESASVMPGLWELPSLRETSVPEKELRMTLRHAIMQVNYYVRIRTVFEDDAEALTIASGRREWIPLGDAARMALTGLTRKVLSRAKLLPKAPLAAVGPELDALV